MNANPYAAPQTILARFHTHNLPMAEARGNEDERRDFREFSTVQLTEFQEKSRVIDTAQIPWLLVAVASTIMAFMFLGSYGDLTSLLSEPKNIPWAVGYVFVILRFCAGIDRRRWMRPLIVGMDALLVVACGFCLISSEFQEFFKLRNSSSMFGSRNAFEVWFWPTLAVLVVIAYLAGKSCYAAFHAPELFSKHRYGHARLCQELDYRNEYGIE